MQTKMTLLRKILKPALIVGSVIAAFYASASLAAVTGLALSSIASNVDTSVVEMASVLSDVSLIAGVGFVMASFFKFHQHRQNPTQVPVSQGVTLLLIGAGLVLFPTILPTAKKTVFGSAEMAHVGGQQIKDLIGSSGG